MRLHHDDSTVELINRHIFDGLQYYHNQFGIFEVDFDLGNRQEVETLEPDKPAHYSLSTDSITLNMDYLVHFYQILSDAIPTTTLTDSLRDPKRLLSHSRKDIIADLSIQNGAVFEDYLAEPFSEYLHTILFPERVMATFAVWDMADLPLTTDYRKAVTKKFVDYQSNYSEQPKVSEVNEFHTRDDNLINIPDFTHARNIGAFEQLVSEAVTLRYLSLQMIELGRGDDDSSDAQFVNWMLGYAAVNGAHALIPYVKARVIEGTRNGKSGLEGIDLDGLTFTDSPN